MSKVVVENVIVVGMDIEGLRIDGLKCYEGIELCWLFHERGDDFCGFFTK